MEWIIVIIAVLLALASISYLHVRSRRELDTLAQAHRQDIQHASAEHDARIDRLKRESDEAKQYVHHSLILDLLPALDALHEALQHTNGDHGSLGEGLVLVTDQLDRVMRKHGVERVSPPAGEPFDPRWHEAVQLVDDEAHAPGTIATCLRHGYRQEDRVIRAALVEVVRQRPSAQPEPSTGARVYDVEEPDEPVGDGAHEDSGLEAPDSDS